MNTYVNGVTQGIDVAAETFRQLARTAAEVAAGLERLRDHPGDPLKKWNGMAAVVDAGLQQLAREAAAGTAAIRMAWVGWERRN